MNTFIKIFLSSLVAFGTCHAVKAQETKNNPGPPITIPRSAFTKGNKELQQRLVKIDWNKMYLRDAVAELLGKTHLSAMLYQKSTSKHIKGNLATDRIKDFGPDALPFVRLRFEQKGWPTRQYFACINIFNWFADKAALPLLASAIGGHEDIAVATRALSSLKYLTKLHPDDTLTAENRKELSTKWKKSLQGWDFPKDFVPSYKKQQMVYGRLPAGVSSGPLENIIYLDDEAKKRLPTGERKVKYYPAGK